MPCAPDATQMDAACDTGRTCVLRWLEETLPPDARLTPVARVPALVAARFVPRGPTRSTIRAEHAHAEHLHVEEMHVDLHAAHRVKPS